MAKGPIEINRAPVLTLWGAIVAERLGHNRAEALSLGKSLAGLNAQTKGQRLGIYASMAKGKAHTEPAGKTRSPQAVALMGRHIPVTRTPDGMLATTKDKPIDPKSVETYLAQKFGDALDEATAALRALAKSRKPAELEETAFALYEQFRPAIPTGTRGWGAKGTLDLELIRKLAAK